MSTTPSDNIANNTHGKTAGRLEDHRFLTGQARFTADMDVEGQLYAIVVRSNHAHAAILDIDNSAAFEVEGVVGVHTITDLDNRLPVTFKGALPDLFREGQGVVAEGYLVDGLFQAKHVLAKHDENYMPKEVADSLKKSGKWKGGSKQ